MNGRAGAHGAQVAAKVDQMMELPLDDFFAAITALLKRCEPTGDGQSGRPSLTSTHTRSLSSGHAVTATLQRYNSKTHGVRSRSSRQHEAGRAERVLAQRLAHKVASCALEDTSGRQRWLDVLHHMCKGRSRPARSASAMLSHG
jgi:hypothetical protein